MAWLLHEPRLCAEVPVFCVVGVRPLLCNRAAPEAISVGAVGLLGRLHSRLAVLALDPGGQGPAAIEPSPDSDYPVLWEVGPLF